MTLKNQLIAQAEELGIKTAKLTITQLKTAIEEAGKSEKKKEPVDKTADPSLDKIEEQAEESEPKFTKAGKRSRKSVLETEEEETRQIRKKETSETPPEPKKIIIPTRPKSQRRSKKYKTAAKKVDSKKTYETNEALNLVIQTSITKFDSSVDLVFALGVNTKQADHNIRDYVVLPAGLGKDLRVAVFAEDEEAEKAIKAGADIAGKEVFLQQLDKGTIDFDILISVPYLMVNLSKYAKLLGPKGLMPNPKSGTVTKDVVKAVKEAKAGRIEYRVTENGLVHFSIGKVSFGEDKLKENFEAVLSSIRNNRPPNFKGIYIKSIYLSTTMGPSVRMSVSS